MADFTGRAAYLQIADDFKRRIRDGELTPGQAPLIESDLMAQHSVSRTVARQAISRLREDGYAISHQGKGKLCRVARRRRSCQAQPRVRTDHGVPV
ncbi:GntR family transcriptional regulator OS=Streptomyces alboniger OX=132473 GN=CP975_16185 PE=4 SV=1 [Streptomyces alboniger]